MDADAIIEGAMRRMTVMAQDPPFRFLETSRAAAAAFMSRLVRFEGYSVDEIASAEAALSVRFTDVFRAYLRQMGKARGTLFCGSHVARLEQLAEFREVAQAMMRETSPSPVDLPSDAVVFLTHQGSQFEFLRPSGGFDSPVFLYTEYDPAPRELAPSFAALIGAELDLQEQNHRGFHKLGGYYNIISDDGGGSSRFPARGPSGRRPTVEPFRLGDRD